MKIKISKIPKGWGLPLAFSTIFKMIPRKFIIKQNKTYPLKCVNIFQRLKSKNVYSRVQFKVNQLFGNLTIVQLIRNIMVYNLRQFKFHHMCRPFMIGDFSIQVNILKDSYASASNPNICLDSLLFVVYYIFKYTESYFYNA